MWITRALSTHPDKGGSASDFRHLQECFEILRDLYDKKQVHPTGFAFYYKNSGRDVEAPVGYTATSYNTFNWFEMAAAESVPSYKVEVAKSRK